MKSELTLKFMYGINSWKKNVETNEANPFNWFLMLLKL